MTKSFFNKSGTISSLITAAKECIREADKVINQDMIDESQIIDCMNKLIALINDPDFSNLGTPLKKMIEHYYNETKGHYMRIIVPAQKSSKSIPEVLFQIPSTEDLSHMRKMPAGGKEDQYQRLTNMTNILKEYPDLPVITTNKAELNQNWNNLFNAIDQENLISAKDILYKISKDDPILNPLLAIHTLGYLEQLIEYSIQALQNEEKIIDLVDSDIVITPKTFEILIKDLATTLQNPAKMCFSFGLPTHHAYSDEGSGFCLINKTAVLIANQAPLKCVVLGSDVNRDDGLEHELRKLVLKQDICHLDIFDSKVYPHHGTLHITKEFGVKGTQVSEGIKLWQKNNLQYYAIDLSKTVRKNNETHPALFFALAETIKQIEQAKAEGGKIALFLPIGWDSHQDETAHCGKMVGRRMLTPEESKKHRFSNKDLGFFYGHIMRIYNNNKEHITGVYWGLEGGYNRKMYEHQIRLFVASIKANMLLPDDVPSYNPGPSSSMHP